jgi:hypothetical protein
MKTEQVFITCDECNAIDATELRFAINGRNYAIDLCGTHRAIFDTLIQPYITNGHAVRFNNHAIRRDGKRNAETVQSDNGEQTVKPKRARKPRAKKAAESTAIDEANRTVNEQWPGAS